MPSLYGVIFTQCLIERRALFHTRKRGRLVSPRRQSHERVGPNVPRQAGGNGAMKLPSEFLLTRLAWANFPSLTAAFMAGSSRRKVRVMQQTEMGPTWNDQWMSKDEVKEFNERKSRSRSQSPKKRKSESPEKRQRGNLKKRQRGRFDNEDDDCSGAAVPKKQRCASNFDVDSDMSWFSYPADLHSR